VHRQRDNPQAPLWLSKQGKVRAIGYDNLWFLLKRLRKRSKIQKPVSARWIRHARLTHLAKVVPEQKLKKFAGWTPNSGMASVYVNLSGKDLDKDILELYGREIEEKKPVQTLLAPIECVRCHSENAATAKFCSTCGMVLSEEEARKLEERQEQMMMELRKKEQEMEELKEAVAKIQPLVDFVNSFDAPENLKKILTFLKDDYTGQHADEKLRPKRIEFSPYVSEKLDEIAKRKGITRKEALEQLVIEDLDLLERGEEKHLETAKARGLPITREDYEEQKKKKRL
jgi:hypothetical protein